MPNVSRAAVAAFLSMCLLLPATGASATEAVASHSNGFSLATPDGDFSLKIYGYGQVRYTFTDNDGSTNLSTFAVQRARLGVTGNAFRDDLAYKLFLNVYSGKAGADVSLFDLSFDFTPSERFGVMVGQFKVPYAVQWVTSAASLQFVDRTTVDGNFRLDRDTGFSLHGEALPGLRYDLGVFDGEGTDQSNPDTGHLWVARLMATPLGKFTMSESDVSGAPDLRVLMALGAALDDNVASHTRSNLDDRLTALGPSDVTIFNAFAGMQWRGLSARVEGHRRHIAPNNPALADETAVGITAQGGWFVIPGALELALRCELFDPDRDAGNDQVRERGLAIGRFWDGHRNKLQADLFWVTTQGAGGTTDDNRLRVQYQLAF